MFSMQLIKRLSQATSVSALTGAGISAESGVPTFRGEEGLWKKFRPEELANFDSFISNPRLVWEWYNYRKHLISQVKPNPGHYALVEMEARFQDFHLITQNVDGLHRLAGSQRIYELHGNIMRSRCVDCNKLIFDISFELGEELPRCECGGLIRPDVVWFGEALPQEELRLAVEAAQQAEVFLCVGTSAIVQPAASLPIQAKYAGAYVVEINLEPTAISTLVDESILGKAGEILPRLLTALAAAN
ncbi:MAG: NAD-dependent deacylase [candidate division KSB1 bacterium]|nr:NAD-dependent deacylase [candidate division KSB1 bacterium]MDZ7318603.1 NAD-dependent deacylase [candidate division KSB1 bacterium]MDZ7339897.1 NAD-dependent deacylase [candidate division KSB1 bacterium]